MTMPTDVAIPPRILWALQNAVPAVYGVPFNFIDPDDLIVTFINIPGGAETQLQLGIDYTVQGGNFDVGQVTVLVDYGNSPDQLRIERHTKRAQPLDYRQGDDFSAESHERALDRLTMVTQDLEMRLLSPEQVRDLVAAFVKAGTGISIKHSDATNELVITNTVTAATIRATIADTLKAGTGMQITVGVGGAITVACTVQGVENLADMVMLEGDQQSGGSVGTGGATFAENVMDIVAAAMSAAGLDLVYDDVAGILTVTNPISEESVRDIIAAALVAGAGVTITPDDAGDKITIQSSGTILTAANIAALLQGMPGISLAVVGGKVQISTDRLDPTYKGLKRDATIVDNFSFADAMHGRGVLFAAATAKVGTLQPNAATALSDGWACVIRNGGAGPLTIARGAGVQLFKNGGQASANAVLASGAVATIVRWDVDSFTIIGPGVS